MTDRPPPPPGAAPAAAPAPLVGAWPTRPPPPVTRPVGRLDAWVACLALCAIASLATWDLVPGLAGVVLFLIWSATRSPADDGPPVLALALTFQWLQVTAGSLYYHLLGRRVVELDRLDLTPMMLLGLGCVAALAVGLAIGLRLLPLRPGPPVPQQPLPGRAVVVGYVLATAVNGTAQAAAFSVPGLTQVIVALTFVRLAMLFVLTQRLLRPRPRPVALALLVVAEIVVGFTGFFADFREALVMVTLAVLDGFARRRRRWVTVLPVLAATLLAALAWTSIKEEYRRSYREHAGFADSVATRLDRLEGLAGEWLDHAPDRIGGDADRLVSRLWAVYYPALAVRRVPSVLPHEDGRLLGAALVHVVTPRLFFPDKKTLDSDSEMVRKYSGVWVASLKQGTSIAFGYATESYIDFGVPGMFVPVLVFGALMGLAYRGLGRLLRQREIAVASRAAIFWLALGLFERSWIKTIGLSVTLLVVLGAAAAALDAVVSRRAAREAARPAPGPGKVAS